MKPFNVQTDARNKYVDAGLTIELCHKIVHDWRDELPPPRVFERSGIMIIDDSVTGVGTKGRWADFLVSQVEEDELVYVQPRCGWAGISLTALAKKHDKKITLFMPASKEASPHQLVCIERGAKPVFRRIAAMPVLNGYAKQYAAERGAFFIPFGLDHPYTVAAGVVSTLQHFPEGPERLWSVISTGVLTRTLQIAWPATQFVGVAVARNLRNGEVGRARTMSYHKPFNQVADIDADTCGVDSAPHYDLKGLEYMFAQEQERPTAFWNVAGEVKPVSLAPADVDSQRDWDKNLLARSTA